MPVVRYVALAALVVWLAAALHAWRGDLLLRIDTVGYACGAIMLVALFVMKFVGPPPPAFIIRVALVAAMVGATALATRTVQVNLFVTTTVVIGFALLFWYARE